MWQYDNLYVYDTSDGRCVFHEYLGEDALSGHIYIDGNDMFVTGKNGVCIDMGAEKWEIKYEIPYLAAVTDDTIVTQFEDVITAYPRYSTEDLIRIGKTELE